MNALTKLLTPPLSVPSKGELVVVSPPPPTLDELVAAARQAHSEAQAASLTAVLAGMEAGKTLCAIKKQLPHGSFEEFVAEKFPFSIRTAQNYMKLARQEPKLRELLIAKAKLGSHLTTREALKFLDTLNPRKKKPKPSP